MTSQQILHSDFLDILFDNRNKEYGAYALRKRYTSGLTKALLFSIFITFFFIVLVSNLSLSTTTSTVDDDPGVIVTSVVNPPIEKPKIEPLKVPPQKQLQVKSQDFQNFKLVHTDPPPLATQNELLQSAISNVKLDGPVIGDWVQPEVTSTNGSGKEVVNVEPPKEIKPDKQPQFPGGMQAWAAFLNSNLRAPQELENGERRIVNIRFHVDVDGIITNFQIVQSGGVPFDNEVIRVLKRMPKWMPALQAGRPVAVSFTQPVTFVGAEE